MKFTLFLCSIVFSAGISSATAIYDGKDIVRIREESQPTHFCNPKRRREAVSLLRALNPETIDHFMTTDRSEWREAIDKRGYKEEAPQGFVFDEEEPDTVPLYRLYNEDDHDHFYTTSRKERSKAVQELGFSFEGITGYIYESEICGSIPLYRMYNAKATDHFYTSSKEERDSAAQAGWDPEGIEGYVFPA
ncbi:hypothetical protein Hypma_005105 [Hypsizygus marmoreus]|uniref:DUF5648 domain-containing protein n=1 Tax=Hypsizygus marmoreus TaxID=39966 RepID=A0A369K5G9_HYPMA|nr:hypothetical protein Hypma_005105 [Hypsizygus marmoreus]